MKAMLFAAGLGSRLRPLTNDKPKALVELQNKTLLQHAIEHLKYYGITDIVINIHHFGEKVLEVLRLNDNFGCNIQISDERNELLETGGGLLKAAALLCKNEEPILLFNVDVISNINLHQMLSYHKEHKNAATLAVRSRESSRYLQFDQDKYLAGWINTSTAEKRVVRKSSTLTNYAFSGVHIIESSLIKSIEEKGKFSITTSYLNLADKFNIMAYPHDQDYWFDVGKPEKLDAANKFLNQKV